MTPKEAQEKQDEIFREMPAERKLRLASRFSAFILRLNALNQNGRISKLARQNRGHSPGVGQRSNPAGRGIQLDQY